MSDTKIAESVDTDTTITITPETLAARLEELKKNHATITDEMTKLETHKQKGMQTLLMLTGAMQMLEELSGQPVAANK